MRVPSVLRGGSVKHDSVSTPLLFIHSRIQIGKQAIEWTRKLQLAIAYLVFPADAVEFPQAEHLKCVQLLSLPAVDLQRLKAHGKDGSEVMIMVS